MSKNIWHSASEIPLFDDTVVFIDDLNNWHTGYTQRDNDGITDHDSGEIYTEENLLRWAYIKDFLTLETELERTKKQLEIAVGALEIISDPIPSEDCTCYLCAQHALDQIKALEQKD
jgi:hypothetical protein